MIELSVENPMHEFRHVSLILSEEFSESPEKGNFLKFCNWYDICSYLEETIFYDKKNMPNFEDTLKAGYVYHWNKNG